MDKNDIAVGRIYASAGSLQQRKVLDIGPHIRPDRAEGLDVPPDDPGLRYENVGGHRKGEISDTYLTAFAAWADREVEVRDPTRPGELGLG